jgi:hypothetical protein
MHRDFWMSMAPERGGAFNAYSPVAKCGTFCADGDNAYVLWHVITFLARLCAANGPVERAALACPLQSVVKRSISDGAKPLIGAIHPTNDPVTTG